jgi:hypothetical protein
MEAMPIVDDVCDRLCNDPKSRAMYIERAEAIETELNLGDLCGAIYPNIHPRRAPPFRLRHLQDSILPLAHGREPTSGGGGGDRDDEDGWRPPKGRRYRKRAA